MKKQDKILKQLEVMKKNKMLSLELAESYRRLGNVNKYWKVYECGTFLEFKKCLQSGEIVISGANFCKDRLCPQCAKRRSLKVFSQLSSVLQEMEQYDYRYLFVTLTIKNCIGAELEQNLKDLSEGFKKFYESRFFRGKNKQFFGCFRSTEITRNAETGEFHPHIHILIAVNKYYFSKANTYYVTQRDISEIWKNCLGLQYFPVCDIRAVKCLKNVKCEVSKYITKGSDFLFPNNPQLTDKLVSLLSDALYRKRFISYKGCFKESYKKLKLKDDDDLINISNINKSKELNYIFYRYKWTIGYYEQLNV